MLGTDRLIYSVGHPFIGNDGAVDFLRGSGLTDEAQAAVAHGNAERLLSL